MCSFFEFRTYFGSFSWYRKINEMVFWLGQWHLQISNKSFIKINSVCAHGFLLIYLFRFNGTAHLNTGGQKEGEGVKEATFTLEYELNRSMTWSITVSKIGRTKPEFGALFPFDFISKWIYGI